MSNRRRYILSLCFLVGSLLAWDVSLLAAGQVTNDIIVTINQVDDTLYPHVQVLASVTDQEGNPIEGLTDADFSLLQDGNRVEPIQATSAAGSQQGIAVVLVIDTSGSMNNVDSSGNSALAMAKDATKSFVSGLNMRLDLIAIISFNSNVIRTHPFSSDIIALNQAIESLTADGETRLYDATSDAAELIATLKPGRKAIIVLTDGQDTESRLTVDDVKDKAWESDVPVYTIGLGPEVDPLLLERLATLTGGRYLETPRAIDIVTSLNTVANQLRKQYVITFDSDMPANDLRHTLSLNVFYGGNNGEDVSSYLARSRPGNAVISIPATGEEVTGQTSISPTLQMPGQVVQVSFLLDSVLQETRSSPPFTFLWDTSQVEVGNHLLSIQVSDHVGNHAEASTTVEVVSRTSPTDAAVSTPAAVNTVTVELEAALINPQEGEELAKPTSLVVEVTKSLYGVRNVEFWVNDEFLDSLQSQPYETVWDVSAFEPGQYVVSALVYDNQGNRLEDNIRVIVNPPPVLLANLAGLSTGQEISQPAHLLVSVDHTTYGVERVEFLDDGAVFAIDSDPPYEVTWDIEDLEQGEHTISARVYDIQGNLWENAVNVMVAPPQTSLPSQYVFIGGGLIVAVFGLIVVVLLVSRWRPPADGYSRQPAPMTSKKISPQAVDGVKHEPAVETVADGLSELKLPPVDVVVDQISTEVRESMDIAATADAAEDDVTFERAARSAWFDQIVTDQPSVPLAYLIGAQGATGQIQEYPLFDRDVTIGRNMDVNIMLLDAKVSRYHAKIRYRSGDFVFIDSQPTNPSYINGEVYSGPHTIKNGDEFIIGRIRLIFRRAN